MAATPSARGSFGSSLGFILAAAGSAIGLGNIWRFPYTAGENGGGAFVMVYLACVALLGVPVLLCEMSIGRRTGLNPIDALKKLAPDSAWKALGVMGVTAGFGILAFYSVVAGWTLAYLGKTLTGDFATKIDAEDSGAAFDALVGDGTLSVLLAGAFLMLTIGVVRGGVSGGIERASKILMPIFFFILVALTIMSLSLPGASKGVDFLLDWDHRKALQPRVMVEAMGQALFSLSVGMGALITYGSYFPKDANIHRAALWVAFADTAIALLAGFMIFPALFSAGVEPGAGPGMVFVVLPTLFAELPAGQVFGTLFYALLAIAALTSTVSLLEVVTAYFVDRGHARTRVVWQIGGACFLLAIPSALSNGSVAALTNFVGGMSFLDTQDRLFGTLALSVGALAMCAFVGWKWGVHNAIDSMEESGHAMHFKSAFVVLVRYVCPAFVTLVLVHTVYGWFSAS